MCLSKKPTRGGRFRGAPITQFAHMTGPTRPRFLHGRTPEDRTDTLLELGCSMGGPVSTTSISYPVKRVVG